MGQPVGGGNESATTLITGAFTATGPSAVQIFYGPFNLALWGAFVGTVQLQRSFDGGTTWVACSTDSLGTPANYSNTNAPLSVTISEVEHIVAYRLNCTAFTSGTINYRLSQTSHIQWGTI